MLHYHKQNRITVDSRIPWLNIFGETKLKSLLIGRFGKSYCVKHGDYERYLYECFERPWLC